MGQSEDVHANTEARCHGNAIRKDTFRSSASRNSGGINRSAAAREGTSAKEKRKSGGEESPEPPILDIRFSPDKTEQRQGHRRAGADVHFCCPEVSYLISGLRCGPLGSGAPRRGHPPQEEEKKNKDGGKASFQTLIFLLASESL